MEMDTKPKVEEILASIYYDKCLKVLDIAINTQITPSMYEVTWDEEVKGVKYILKTFFPLEDSRLYIFKDPKLKVLIERYGCYYTED
jgi:hypothetical protein